MSGDPRLTPERLDVLAAVLDGSRTYGDLVAALGIARSTVAWHLQTLRSLRLVDWTPGLHGTIRPVIAGTAR
jgi:DNA-binding transcriptional ArsR family regulator